MSTTPSGGDLLAVVFDVDGTLAETERDGHRVAYNRAFSDLGLPHHWSEQQYRELLLTAGGLPRTIGFLRQQGESAAAAEQVGRRVHEKAVLHFLDWMHAEATLRPGLDVLLAELSDAGVLLGVATAGRASWVMPFLQKVAPGVEFAQVVTFEDVDQLKPDPQAYQIVVSRLGVTTSQAMAVEDSEVGMRSALAAGLSCLVVPAHYTEDQDFTAASAVVPSFTELDLDQLRKVHAG